jgi:hypothetical protein
MRRNDIVKILLSAIMLMSLGCAWEPGIDKGKFSELNRTAQQLQTSISSDKPCDIPDTLLQKLDTGIAAVKDKTASKGERDVIAAYSRLLATYKDGVLLCQYRTQMKQFEFVPRGRIYVFQELDPLVDKYGLSTERHLYAPTGVHWKSIAADSIKVIWESAAVQLKNIETMVNYN